MTLLLFSFTPVSKPLYMTSLSCSCVCSLSPSLNIRLFKVPRILKFHDEFGIDVISPLCVCVCVGVASVAILVGFVQYRKVCLDFWEIFIIELLDIGSLGLLLCSAP